METLKWTLLGLGALAGAGGLIYWLDKDGTTSPPLLGAATRDSATPPARAQPKPEESKNMLEQLDTGSKVALAIAGVGALATVAAAVIANRRREVDYRRAESPYA